MKKPATMYLDFVSPFAYFAICHLDELSEDLEFVFKPVLFAGLLNHWKHKGPAEIPAKKIHTFHYVRWYADRNGIDFRIPPAHPFNPIRALRLAIALGASRQVMDTLFRCIWVDGNLPDFDAGWAAMKSAVGSQDADTLIANQDIKDELRANGEDAIAEGVFGVPTIVVDGHLFWGIDSFGMLKDYLKDTKMIDGPEGRNAAAVQPSSTR